MQNMERVSEVELLLLRVLFSFLLRRSQAGSLKGGMLVLVTGSVRDSERDGQDSQAGGYEVLFSASTIL